MKLICPFTGKRQFVSEATAQLFISCQSLRKKRKGFKPLTNAYKCKDCNLWHTTTRKAR